MLREGTIVDASIIAAPKSTKNKEGKRDPEMHQTKKGNEWHFGMKMHTGADAELGLAHSLTTTSANVDDITGADKLWHGDESTVWGDAGNQGVHKRKEHGGRKVTWHVSMRPGKRRALQPESIETIEEKSKASIRAGVEHPFRYVKRMFHYSEVQYRGLRKNSERIALLLGCTNLLIGDTDEFV